MLSTLESFGRLVEDHGDSLLIGLTNVVSTECHISIRFETLSSLIRIVQNTDIVKPLSCVMHPLIQVIAGSPNE